MSSFKQPNLDVGKVAGADLSARIYTFGKYDASGDVISAGAGEGDGIIQNDPASGEFVEFAKAGGGALLELAATLAPGALVKSDAAGKGVAATTANDLGLAKIIQGGVSGDIVEVEPVNIRVHA